MKLWGTVLRATAVLFAAARNNNNHDNNTAKIEQLEMRLQLGYEAAEEARSMMADQKYEEASRSFADALNLGRKPALALQEVTVCDGGKLQQEALQWVVDVFCESAVLNMDRLNDLDGARSDAWAACVFSQYQQRQPLQCMRQVCQQGKDYIGEFQACQQLINLPFKELTQNDPERDTLANRIEELEKVLNGKQ